MIIKDDSIIDFLEGSTKDYRDRTYGNILSCSDTKMEECHDQVQWIFPLHEESNFASTYPVLTHDIVQKAKQSENVKDNLIKAKNRMEKFYAIGEFEDVDKQRKWCRNHNHNLLRITRIIRCLRIFGLETESKDFYRKVMKAADKFGVSNTTIHYWNKASNDDIWESLR